VYTPAEAGLAHRLRMANYPTTRPDRIPQPKLQTKSITSANVAVAWEASISLIIQKVSSLSHIIAEVTSLDSDKTDENLMNSESVGESVGVFVGWR